MIVHNYRECLVLTVMIRIALLKQLNRDTQSHGCSYIEHVFVSYMQTWVPFSH